MKYISIKILLQCLAFIVIVGEVHSQSDNDYASNTVFAEVGGAGGLWSLNYDRSIWQISESFKLHGRVGVGMMSEFNGSGFPDVFIPLSTHVIWGKIAHRIEAGGGVTFMNWTYRDHLSTSGFDRKSQFLGHLTVGYRYQKMDGGIMFRATYTPFIDNNSNVPFEHWAGISVGYTFKNK
ncbi:MAG: hypothetical protein ACI837_001137 [Crocinitomicaceae bacterium]|jgi:hypothetical protein